MKGVAIIVVRDSKVLE